MKPPMTPTTRPAITKPTQSPVIFGPEDFTLVFV
ncbi:unnamed protein product, partial [Rotaria magnacalcarata]